MSGTENFSLRWVGRAGDAKSPRAPSDDEMAKTIESYAGKIDPKPESIVIPVDGQLKFRTIYPSFAREQSCVDCHNKLQPDPNWKLNDLMGAFAIDVPIGPFMTTLIEQSTGLAIALFIGLALVGFVVSRQHYRQMIERETVNAELGRTRAFLDTIIEHMPAILSVKRARSCLSISISEATRLAPAISLAAVECGGRRCSGASSHP